MSPPKMGDSIVYLTRVDLEFRSQSRASDDEEMVGNARFFLLSEVVEKQERETHVR